MVIAKAARRDIDTDAAGSPSRDVGKVVKVFEAAVDVHVEVAAVLTEEKGKTVDRELEEDEVSVVDCYLLTRTASAPLIPDLCVTIIGSYSRESGPLIRRHGDRGTPINEHAPDYVHRP